MMSKKYSYWLGFILFLITTASCSTSTRVAVPQNQNLYNQLGQHEGIDAVVVEFIHILAKDERVKNRFRGVNMDKFRKGFTEYICAVASGPCTYAGDSLQQIHAGYNYTDTEFNATVGNLIAAMERKNVSVGAQNTLLKLLAPSYKDIIYQ